jgi:hypothetical protein
MGRERIPPAHLALKTKRPLNAGSYFAEAIAAVNRLVPAGFKRHLGVFAAVGAFYREHLARGAGIAAVSGLRFPGLPAGGAASGLISVAPGLELLLFIGAVDKSSRAIGTGNGLILKTHWMTSFLKDLAEAKVIQDLM